MSSLHNQFGKILRAALGFLILSLIFVQLRETFLGPFMECPYHQNCPFGFKCRKSHCKYHKHCPYANHCPYYMAK